MNSSGTHLQLKLFVAGSSSRTERAITNLKDICEEEFAGCFELLVIDVLKQPEIAEREKVLATPTLIKEGPLPVRRVIGDFSDKEKLVAALGLPAGSTNNLAQGN